MKREGNAGMCEKEGDVETYLEKILYRKEKKERMLTRYVGENIEYRI